MGHDIVFTLENCHPSVVGYLYSNYVSDMNNRSFTVGYAFTLLGVSI